MKQLLTIALIMVTFIGCSNNPQGTLDPISLGAADTITQESEMIPWTIDTIPQEIDTLSQTTTIPGNAKIVPLAAGNVWEYWYAAQEGTMNTTPEGIRHSTTYTQGVHRYTLIAMITDTRWQCERAFADSIVIKGMDNQMTFLKDSILIDTIEISSCGNNLSSGTPDPFISSGRSSSEPLRQCVVHFDNSDITIGHRSWIARMDGCSELYTPSVGLVYRLSQWAGTSGSGETNFTLLSFNGIPYDGAKLYDFAKKNECP